MSVCTCVLRAFEVVVSLYEERVGGMVADTVEVSVECG